MENSTHILVLHGWGSSPQRWSDLKKNIQALSPGIIVDIPFIPGFDPQTPVKTPFTIDDYATWVKNYIIKHNLKKPVVIGHSNGGRILMRVASHNSKLISKLILINSAGVPEKNSVKKSIFKVMAKTGRVALSIFNRTPIEKLSKKILYKLAGESDYNKASPVMKKTMINMLAYDPRKDLKKIKNSTLCIWGEKDKSTPLWMGRHIRESIKKSKVEIIHGGGHNIHRTHPTRVAQLVVDFINE